MQVISDNGMGVEMKKGPWTAEEDEVLINHVKKHGPKSWSSIRSNGLLPRTGKSCRLRWVNKLRPNLKSGCKFSAEEERTVMDLQAEFGNKWAKIATYLPGRTDNDVKNFWSSRQKRLARILQTASASSSTKSLKNNGKSTALEAMPISVLPFSSSFSMGKEESSSTQEQCCQPSCFGNSEMFKSKKVALPHWEKPDLLFLETNLHITEAKPILAIPSNESFPYSFSPDLPESNLHLPLMADCHKLVLETGDPNFLDMFDEQEVESNQKTALELQTRGLEGSMEDGYFDDFQMTCLITMSLFRAHWSGQLEERTTKLSTSLLFVQWH